MKDIALPNTQVEKIEKMIASVKYLDKLNSWGIQGNSRILFVGPPGTGKTLAAHIIASELKCGIQYVRLDSLISSYLGETGKNIREVFEYPTNESLIIFLDEFDTIAKKRDDGKETGEIKRVVNTLIQNIDILGQSKIIVAATNHPELLDSALWRRFDNILEFTLPSDQLRKKIIEIHTKYLPISKSVSVDMLVEMSAGYTGSDIAQWIKLSSVNAVTNGRGQVVPIDFASAFLEVENQIKIKERYDSPKITKKDSSLSNKIRLLNKLGLTYKAIGTAYGVSISTAWRLGHL